VLLATMALAAALGQAHNFLAARRAYGISGVDQHGGSSSSTTTAMHTVTSSQPVAVSSRGEKIYHSPVALQQVPLTVQPAPGRSAPLLSTRRIPASAVAPPPAGAAAPMPSAVRDVEVLTAHGSRARARCASPWAVTSNQSSAPSTPRSMGSPGSPGRTLHSTKPAAPTPSPAASPILHNRSCAQSDNSTFKEALPQFGQDVTQQDSMRFSPRRSDASLQGKSAQAEARKGAHARAMHKIEEEKEKVTVEAIIRDFQQAMERDFKESRVLAQSPDLIPQLPPLSLRNGRGGPTGSQSSESLYSSPVTSARQLNRTARTNPSLKALGLAAAETNRLSARSSQSRSASPPQSARATGGYSPQNSTRSLATATVGGSISVPAALTFECESLAASNSQAAAAARIAIAKQQQEARNQREKVDKLQGKAFQQYEIAAKAARRKGGPKSPSSSPASSPSATPNTKLRNMRGTQLAFSYGSFGRAQGTTPTWLAGKRLPVGGASSNPQTPLQQCREACQSALHFQEVSSSAAGGFSVKLQEVLGESFAVQPSLSQAPEFTARDVSAPEVASEPLGHEMPAEE